MLILFWWHKVERFPGLLPIYLACGTVLLLTTSGSQGPSSLGAHYDNCSQVDFDSWLPPSGLCCSETMHSTLQSVSIADAGLSSYHPWLQDMWYA